MVSQPAQAPPSESERSEPRPRTLPEVAAYAIAVVCGMAVWWWIAKVGGRREAWDSPLYFQVVQPATMLVGALLGLAAPREAWRWGVAIYGGQAVLAVAQNPTGSLLPLGLIAFGVLSIPTVLCSELGGWLRRRAWR